MLALVKGKGGCQAISLTGGFLIIKKLSQLMLTSPLKRLSKNSNYSKINIKMKKQDIYEKLKVKEMKK